MVTRDECKILVKGMKAVYADPKFIADKDAFDVWYGLLSDLDYKTASKALQRYMMTEHFPPMPADIREEYRDLTHPDDLTESEAWHLASYAIANSGWEPEKQFKELPPLIQEIVGSPEALRAKGLDEHYNAEVEESNFRRAYRNLQARREKEEMLPKNLRKAAQKTQKVEEKGNEIEKLKPEPEQETS